MSVLLKNFPQNQLIITVVVHRNTPNFRPVEKEGNYPYYFDTGDAVSRRKYVDLVRWEIDVISLNTGDGHGYHKKTVSSNMNSFTGDRSGLSNILTHHCCPVT